jgi:hypothetical protein
VRFAVLLWMASAAAGQTPKPFSHQLHLKLPAKLTCVTCHSGVQSSTRAEDNNLPPVATCLGCHKEAAIGQPRPTLLARFNHQKHLALGNIAPVIRAAIDSKAYSPRQAISGGIWIARIPARPATAAWKNPRHW